MNENIRTLRQVVGQRLDNVRAMLLNNDFKAARQGLESTLEAARMLEAEADKERKEEERESL